VDLYREYKKPYRSVLFVGSSSVSDFRMGLAARWLGEWGWHTEIEVSSIATWMASKFDAIVCARPNLDICRCLLAWMAGRTPIVVDMDDDFSSIPKTNPAYISIGPGGNPAYHPLLKETITLATGFTSTTAEIGKRYKRESVVIPNPWDETNPNCKLERKPGALINIGWTGTTTHREDFKLVQPALVRILKEREDVGIVIGMDDALYDQFRFLPPHRRMFIPPLSYRDYPMTFHHMDILVSPLEDTHFTRAKSDIKLLDAASQGVVWVASPVQPYLEAKGGIFADSEDEWYQKLLCLIDDATFRMATGFIGKEWAWDRRSEVYARQWESYLETLL
jgi:glycosyltransferase involved in cell wall biosynthesis